MWPADWFSFRKVESVRLFSIKRRQLLLLFTIILSEYAVLSLGGPDDVFGDATAHHHNSYHHHTTSQHELQDPAGSYLALCLIVKNQAQELQEWVQHHVALGFRTIYVWDHNSTVPLSGILTPWIDARIVHYIHFGHSVSRKPQVWAYEQCLELFGSRHRWIGFFDTDEFLFTQDPSTTVTDVLRQYEHVGGIAVNWRMFGSSGLVERPESVVRSYTKCTLASSRLNILVKQLINTNYSGRPAGSPHHFKYTDGAHSQTTCGEILDGPSSQDPCFKDLVLHHYFNKSWEEYKEKMNRGTGQLMKKGWDHFYILDMYSQDNCTQHLTSALTV